MYLSTSSSDRDAAMPAEPRPLRAGLRVPPPSEQPNGVFVVVEMVVLVIVAALAMVAIIVSSGGTEDEVHATDTTVQARVQAAREGGAGTLAGPSARVGQRSDAPVTPR